MSYDNTKYVRCHYCDTAITADQLDVEPKEKTSGDPPGLDKVYFICPACGHSNLGYVFNVEKKESI